MSKPKVYITRELFDEAIERIKKYYDVEIWDRYTPPPPEILREKLKEVDAAVTLLTDKINCELLKECKNLRIIAQYAVGYDNIDVECATKLGVYVTNTPGVLTDATAELTWALILAAARRIVEADNFVRWGEWWRKETGWHPKMMLGVQVSGKTLGIIGMGRIGRAVAKRAKGFDMKILYYDVRRLPEELEKELNATYVDLDTLLRESDIITIHTPLTKETYHLINEENIKKMKKGVVLVNTSRGAVIDTEALIKALKEGHIAAVGLDVFEQEPIPPNHPLTAFKNAVLVPHIGSATYETRLKMAMLVADNLIAFYEGREPPTLVNKDVLKVRPPGFK